MLLILLLVLAGTALETVLTDHAWVLQPYDDDGLCTANMALLSVSASGSLRVLNLTLPCCSCPQRLSLNPAFPLLLVLCNDVSGRTSATPQV
jgi:hypothetical protein